MQRERGFRMNAFVDKLSRYEKVRISTDELQEIFGVAEYGAFYLIVSNLVEEGKLEPIKASRLNGRMPPLYNRYRIVREQNDPAAFVAEIRLLNPGLNIEGYLARPQVYRKHREVILGLSRYLWHHPELLAKPMSCKERSFSIWGKEKFLEQNRALVKEVLEFNGLAPGFLHTYDTPEPFFEYVFAAAGSTKVCIIENKDTWFTFRKLMRETGKNIFFGEPVHVLIYGEGNKITKPDALREYAREMLGQQEAAVRFLYFGDLDKEGIRLYARTRKANPGIDLHLFVPFYSLMMKLASDRELPLSHDRRDIPVPWEEFLPSFPLAEQQRMQEIINSGRYIPQEVINYPVLASLLS